MSLCRSIATSALGLVLAASSAGAAQHHPPSHADSEAPNEASIFLMSLASGTSRNPTGWPMPMGVTAAGNWQISWMGQLFLNYTYQSGPRGGEKFFVPNNFMLGALRDLGGGSLLIRGMTSLEPATVSNRSYPLLFQTGETAFGEPLVDGQHPHDLVMELGVHYAREMGDALVTLYYAPVGDAALGPPSFPHRASALELPQAPLGHHWQDSTHIATNVVTAGVNVGALRLEASGLHGGEPDEDRWDLSVGAIDSWTSRVVLVPDDRWLFQVSAGRLEKPEAFHEDDIVRATASLHYTVPRGESTSWSSSVIWGRNYKTVEQRATQAILFETLLPLGTKSFVTGRLEWSQRDELFAFDHELEERIEEELGSHVFDVTSLTVGYTRDVASVLGLRVGVGGNVTYHVTPSSLDPFYGAHPYGVNVFMRWRLGDAMTVHHGQGH